MKIKMKLKRDPLFKMLIIFALSILALTVVYLIYIAITVPAIYGGTAVITTSFIAFSYTVLSANALLIILAALYIPFRKV